MAAVAAAAVASPEDEPAAVVPRRALPSGGASAALARTPVALPRLRTPVEALACVEARA